MKQRILCLDINHFGRNIRNVKKKLVRPNLVPYPI